MSLTSEFNRFPLYFAPNIAWMRAFLLCENPVIVNDAKFVKQTFRNRFVYGTFQGPKEFSIPIVGETRKLPYSEVEINYGSSWDRQFLQSLKSAYGKSPFYEFYDYKIEALIAKRHLLLWDFNLELLKLILSCLKIETQFEIKPGYFNTELSFNNDTNIKYYQVFLDKIPFMNNLTVLDLLFNEGVDAFNILLKKD
jgi:hypothetical protein